jgi:histidinol-phosphate aminotransferase
VRLHRNENAFGPSAAAIAAIRESSSIANRYPGMQVDALRERLAGLHGVSPSNIVLGCGSSESLRMAAAAFTGPGRGLVAALPTFPLLMDYAIDEGANVAAVPLTSAHAHDLDAMLAKTSGETGLVYICNPNNPTGTLTRRRDLELFLRELPPTTHVLIDEAYHHYVQRSADYASFIDRPIEDDRVIVTRTFSAIHGLAGLRIGYAVAAPGVASQLAAARVSDGVSTIAASAALAAVDDVDHVKRSVQQNADDRQEFFNQANARMLRSLDSHANFVLLNMDRSAIEVEAHFRKHGVLVAGPFPLFQKYIRVSLGTRDDMQAFWRVLDLLPRHSMTM